MQGGGPMTWHETIQRAFKSCMGMLDQGPRSVDWWWAMGTCLFVAQVLGWLVGAYVEALGGLWCCSTSVHPHFHHP